MPVKLLPVVELHEDVVQHIAGQVHNEDVKKDCWKLLTRNVDGKINTHNQINKDDRCNKNLSETSSPFILP